MEWEQIQILLRYAVMNFSRMYLRTSFTNATTEGALANPYRVFIVARGSSTGDLP